MIRVFLLDDHGVVRRGLRELLDAQGDIEVIGESGLAREAIHRAPALRPNASSLTTTVTRCGSIATSIQVAAR